MFLFPYGPIGHAQPSQPGAKDRIPPRVVAAIDFIEHVNHAVTDPPDLSSFGGGRGGARETRILNKHEQEAYSAALQLASRYFQGEQYPETSPFENWTEALPEEPGAYVHFSLITQQFHLSLVRPMSDGVRIFIYGQPGNTVARGWWLQVPEAKFFDQAIAACMVSPDKPAEGDGQCPPGT